MTAHLIGLIGAGIGSSLSPALHEREAQHHGLRYLYKILDISELGVDAAAAGDLVRTARRVGYTGLNITHPCKQTVIEHLDELSPDAARLGAVNTVTFDGDRAIGHNTDWTGFAESFARGLPDAATRRVVQVGAGGAGAAVAHALLTMGADQVTLVDTRTARADALAAQLTRHFGPGRARSAPVADLAASLRHADGLVNATPIGMSGHPGSPVPADLLRPDLWVADVVYRPLRTELLEQARAAGCRTLDGGGMVVFQAAHAFRLFTGLTPDTDRMLAHLSALVAA
ncbi:shikimate dehydrogenase (NADP(+)) [Actinomadura sp. NBRC 104425]|uniref:shikimate dehydrogenase n=1 Tax=Actinomadura sp. NBRC 104425 TaxID=3032204 RepID=UPI0024A4D8D9|nr:shikimate dehydrogenase [Actinomadura sp. NBRC 104425]GLZ15837.1 shikimate dehydrogenase (NADP(+)) [Actinomadura sp. NBRC 104425]